MKKYIKILVLSLDIGIMEDFFYIFNNFQYF